MKNGEPCTLRGVSTVLEGVTPRPLTKESMAWCFLPCYNTPSKSLLIVLNIILFINVFCGETLVHCGDVLDLYFVEKYNKIKTGVINLWFMRDYVICVLNAVKCIFSIKRKNFQQFVQITMWK